MGAADRVRKQIFPYIICKFSQYNPGRNNLAGKSEMRKDSCEMMVLNGESSYDRLNRGFLSDSEFSLLNQDGKSVP